MSPALRARKYEFFAQRGRHSGDSRPRASVSLVGEGPGGACVLELVTTRSRNVMSQVFATLCALRLRLVHTEVKVDAGRILQRVHLLEPDETPLKPRRMLLALNALAEAFTNPDRAVSSHGAAQ